MREPRAVAKHSAEERDQFGRGLFAAHHQKFTRVGLGRDVVLDFHGVRRIATHQAYQFAAQRGLETFGALRVCVQKPVHSHEPEVANPADRLCPGIGQREIEI